MKLLDWLGRGHKGAEVRPLGALERLLMSQLWEAGEVSVREVQEHHSHLAYTTVMTTLDRLYKKGLLRRRKHGRAFLYAAAVTREEFAAAMARQALRIMGSYAGADAVLSTFVNVVSDSDARLLDELEQLVKSKRRQQRRAP
ncbi:MAG TPA: BlaI/MecI/CopY family transcriptional regulator [Terriglobales bacterium]|nr:BlaI/MecI/CopY family transcriptional regulator [Terriglobales bacterium]